MGLDVYDRSFYEGQSSSSLRSARRVLEIANELLHPASVIDVGCGVGTWLRAWMELGVREVLGVDGDYVAHDQLLIPLERFSPMDLNAPVGISRTFDLVESLEVAEHLLPSSAERFVSFLCSLGPVILFSAAIPGQGGVNHINEQWPDYWAEIFAKNGFEVVDVLRDRIWSIAEIEPWYCQNIMFFVRSELASTIEDLQRLSKRHNESPQARVHPRTWIGRIQPPPPGPRKLLRMLPASIGRAIRRRLHKSPDPNA